jgi:hypothetical protein
MGKPVVGEVVVLPFPQTDLQAGNVVLLSSLPNFRETI